MRPDEHEKFTKMHAESQLVKPEDTGHVIAGLAIGADPKLSGEFLNWNGEEAKEFRRKD